MWSPSQVAKVRIARRKSAVSADINLVGLLSVSISLLFFLMVLRPPRVGILADLPVAKTADLQPHAVREDAIRIMVARDGRVFFRNAPVASEELPGLIRAALQEGAEEEVYLAVDSRAKNGDVKPVIDQMRLAGIRSVVILANKPGNSAAQEASR